MEEATLQAIIIWSAKITKINNQNTQAAKTPTIPTTPTIATALVKLVTIDSKRRASFRLRLTRDTMVVRIKATPTPQEVKNRDLPIIKTLQTPIKMVHKRRLPLAQAKIVVLPDQALLLNTFMLKTRAREIIGLIRILQQEVERAPVPTKMLHPLNSSKTATLKAAKIKAITIRASIQDLHHQVMETQDLAIRDRKRTQVCQPNNHNTT